LDDFGDVFCFFVDAVVKWDVRIEEFYLRFEEVPVGGF
jgi:hypothetical protein